MAKTGEEIQAELEREAMEDTPKHPLRDTILGELVRASREKNQTPPLVPGPPPTKPEQPNAFDQFLICHKALRVLPPVEQERVLRALWELLGLGPRG